MKQIHSPRERLASYINHMAAGTGEIMREHPCSFGGIKGERGTPAAVRWNGHAKAIVPSGVAKRCSALRAVDEIPVDRDV